MFRGIEGRRSLAMAAVAFAAAGLVVFNTARPSETVNTPPTAHNSIGAVIDTPRSVTIPSLTLDAPLIELGLQDDGTLEVPTDPDEAGWFAGGPEPGEVGAAVIAGHVDSKSGPAVFYGIGDLTEGDQITVSGHDGDDLTFVVQRSERYPKDQFPTSDVYGPTTEPELRLITCGGDFDRSTGHYRDNVVVFATLA